MSMSSLDILGRDLYQSIGQKDWDNYKKGVIWVELDDDVCYTLCFPMGESYFKFFLISDLLSDRMELVPEPIRLKLGTCQHPVNQILCQMGATFRMDGNLCIYTFDKQKARLINPFEILGKKKRKEVIASGKPICLVDEKRVVHGYWFNKELSLGIFEKIIWVSMPVKII